MTLRHELAGEEGAPVVVLSGPLGSTLELWAPQVEALRSRFRLLRYDHPGHGGSPLPDRPDVEAFAAQVLDLLDDLGLGRVSFCGLSLGGAVGMQLALAAPARVERLVLCCTAARIGTPAGWAERAAAVRGGGIGAVADASAARWLTPGFAAANPDLVRWCRELIAATPAEGYARCCEALAAFDVRGRLDDVRCPTLVVAGAEDPAVPPADARALAAAIAGAELVVLPAAHVPGLECAGAFDEALTGFLTAEVKV